VKNILVIAETAQGVPLAVTCELLGLARTLASGTGGAVCAAVLGGGDPQALIAGGADRVFVVKQPESGDYYESDVWLSALGPVLDAAEPAAILVAHTPTGADLAPRLAFRLKVAVATACEAVTLDGKLRVVRPCYGNKAREVLRLETVPAIVTVRAKVCDAAVPDSARKGEVIEVASPRMEQTLSRVVARKLEESSASARLESANVIVAGGRGVGGPEGFGVLEALAAVLEGAVGASRVACDLGWCPHSWQIGLTGKTVTPELYIAVGISGASHHMAGCGNSKTIVAINSDPEAAIFREARFGIVGDFREVVPALTAEISRRRSR